MENLYFNTYEHTIDDKSRLTIPSKLRAKLGAVVYLSLEFDNCLSIRDANGFGKWSEDINRFKSTDPRARILKRSLFSNTEELEFDNSGRIKIPTRLAKIANLQKDVIIIGAGDHLEVWDVKAYDDYLNGQTESIEQVAEKLGDEVEHDR